MYYYCLTLRKCSPIRSHQVDRLIKSYHSYIKNMQKDDEKLEIDFHYEVETKKNGKYNVHIHGMFRTPNAFIKAKPKRGYSIRVERIKSKMAWIAYMTKKPYTSKEIKEYIRMLEATSSPSEEYISEPDAPEWKPTNIKLFS